MQELQVPTRSVEVRLHTTVGERLEGQIFVFESPYDAGGLAEVSRALNDERRFLPFTDDRPDRGSSILNKNSLVLVHVPVTGAEDAFGPDDLSDPCTLSLSDGVELVGRVALVTPFCQSRLLDKLNQAERFVPIVTDEGIDFVHCGHLSRVR